MSGSGYSGFGSGLGPGLTISKNAMNSMVGPGGSGWSGSFSLFSVGGGKTVHKERMVMTKNRGVHKGGGITRTYPDHPDPSRVSAGLRTTPYPDPTRTHLDPTRTQGHRREVGQGPCQFHPEKPGKIGTPCQKLPRQALSSQRDWENPGNIWFLCQGFLCGDAWRKTRPASQVKNA
jgi:hypothetical protein